MYLIGYSDFVSSESSIKTGFISQYRIMAAQM
jgi:hypothetical protein